jgi:hypothetical protein
VGATVVCADIDRKGAEKAVDRIGEAGGTASAVRCDGRRRTRSDASSRKSSTSTAGWTAV